MIPNNEYSTENRRHNKAALAQSKSHEPLPACQSMVPADRAAVASLAELAWASINVLLGGVGI